jgi:hypothetical protein
MIVTNKSSVNTKMEESLSSDTPEVVTTVSNSLFVAPPALQPTLLPCPDQIFDNGYAPAINFGAPSVKSSSSLLLADAQHNSKESCPKEIPDINTTIQLGQEVTPMAQLQFLLPHPIADHKVPRDVAPQLPVPPVFWCYRPGPNTVGAYTTNTRDGPQGTSTTVAAIGGNRTTVDPPTTP